MLHKMKNLWKKLRKKLTELSLIKISLKIQRFRCISKLLLQPIKWLLNQFHFKKYQNLKIQMLLVQFNVKISKFLNNFKNKNKILYIHKSPLTSSTKILKETHFYKNLTWQKNLMNFKISIFLKLVHKKKFLDLKLTHMQIEYWHLHKANSKKYKKHQEIADFNK